ncbi:MAG: acylneuraminate cytidylyltransferase family protein [Pseudomonadota bacterium]
MTARRVAIIPARGGSKRLPRKNILPVNGQPIISYPIAAARASNLFDEVLVSTEDSEIAEIAAHFGAKIVSRPAEYARDQSSVVDVCNHVLESESYSDVTEFCCIYATALFLCSEQIVAAYALFSNSTSTDCVMGVSSYNYHPVQAMKKEGDYLVSMWPEYEQLKSQDYPELVVSNGSLYWCCRAAFQEQQTFYTRNLQGYKLNSIDIDTDADYQAAIELAERYSPGRDIL